METESLQLLLESNENFQKAYHYADKLTLEELLEEFNKLSYESSDYGVVMLFKKTGTPGWHACFRNYINWRDLPQFSFETPKETLQNMFAWSCYKGHLKIE